MTGPRQQARGAELMNLLYLRHIERPGGGINLQGLGTHISSQGVTTDSRPHGCAAPHLGELDAPLLSVFQHAILINGVQCGVGGCASENAAAICAALQQQQRCTLLQMAQLGQRASRAALPARCTQSGSDRMRTFCW